MQARGKIKPCAAWILVLILTVSLMPVSAIGEAIDADGITGGYNMQLCWSTAAAAADDLRGDL